MLLPSLSFSLPHSQSFLISTISAFFFPPPAVKAEGAVPRGSVVCFVCVIFACVSERVQEIVNMQKRLREKDSEIVRGGGGCVSSRVLGCVCVRVPPFLRLSNWDMGSVCALHQPF